MKRHWNVIGLSTLFLSLFTFGVLLEPVYALGDHRKSRLSSSRLRTHPSIISPSFSKSSGVRSKSISPLKSELRTPSVPLETLILKKRVFKNRHHLFQSPFLFIPITPEPAESMAVDLVEDDGSEAPLEEEATSSPLSHPLIIEERCGEYVQIPWIESGVLYEPVKEARCPD